MKVTLSGTKDIGLGTKISIKDAQINELKVDVKTQRYGNSDYHRYISGFLPLKTIRLTGTLLTDSGTLRSYYSEQMAIAHLLRPEPNYLVNIDIETETGFTSRIQGYLKDFSAENQADKPNFGGYNLEFVCPDPFYYSTSVNTYSCLLQEAGLYLDFYLDQAFGLGVGYNRLEFTNTGLATYPTITITGSTRNLRIVNQLGDTFYIGSITDPFLLIGNRQIMIDTERRVITLDGQSLYYATSGWETLKIYPGDNVWNIATDGFNNSTSEVEIMFYTKYLTVL